MYREEIEEIFMPCLNGVADVMTEQLLLAKAKGLTVKVK
jgi:hypothetical protein